MRLDRKMVNIMDHENKEVVERFPIHLVREPTAFTSSDPKVRRKLRQCRDNIHHIPYTNTAVL